MTQAPPSLSFRGGAFASALPMLFFIVWAIVICLSGAPDVKGLILGLIDAGLTPLPLFEGDYTPRLEFLAELPPGKVAAHFDRVDRWFRSGLCKETRRAHTCTSTSCTSESVCCRGRSNTP